MSGNPIYEKYGIENSESDQNKNKNTISCLKSGIKIFIGHSIKNIKKATILVKSTAIKNNNVEVKYAKEKNTNLSKQMY